MPLATHAVYQNQMNTHFLASNCQKSQRMQTCKYPICSTKIKELKNIFNPQITITTTVQKDPNIKNSRNVQENSKKHHKLIILRKISYVPECFEFCECSTELATELREVMHCLPVLKIQTPGKGLGEEIGTHLQFTNC